MPVSPVIPDASHADVDLLRTTPAEITVSSVVQNPTDRPANLIDGNPATAWSSRTGLLEGTEIDFRLPASAAVTEIRMTAGMTRATDAGDLFSMNPRIAEVMVFRDGVRVGVFPLDVAQRGLQSLRIDRQGGLFRVVFTRVTPGSNPRWREASVSEFQLRGRTPSPVASTPVVRVGILVPDTLPSALYTLAPDARLPWGCLAWSVTRSAAACVTGFWGNNIPQTRDSTDLSQYILHFAGDPAARDVTLVDPTVDAGNAWDPADVPPSVRTLRSVQSALTAGGYVSLAGFSERMESGFAHEWVEGAAVRWTRRRTSAGGENAAQRFSDRFEVRWARGAAFEPIDVSSEDQATEGADFLLYRVPGGRHLVIEQDWIYADEGVSGHATTVFVCDRTGRTCQ